jgi:hypothetical protein
MNFIQLIAPPLGILSFDEIGSRVVQRVSACDRTAGTAARVHEELYVSCVMLPMFSDRKKEVNCVGFRNPTARPMFLAT